MADAGEYFEQSQLWGREPEPYQLQVRQDLLRLIGGDVGSILDVGCGDGIITNALPAHIKVVGVDTSAEALTHVRRESVRASAAELPFPDASFDLVMANDLLEHLDEATNSRTVSEMRRVARRWIFITVPFMECIESAMTRCGFCGQIYHVNHHQRAYGTKEIRAQIPGILPRLMVFSGAAQNPLEAVQRSLRARHGLLTQWDLATCPSCGEKASMGSATGLCAVSDDLAGELAALAGPRLPDRSECIAVYSIDGTLPLTMPVRADLRLSVVKCAAGEWLEIPAQFRMEAGARLLQMEHDSEAAGVYLRESAGGVDFLYAAPTAVQPGCLQVPDWFNAAELPEISAQGGAGALALPGLELLAQSRRKEAASSSLRAAMEENNALEVRLQNLAAQNAVLLQKAGAFEQVKIDAQNLRAENDAFKLKQGRLEQMQVDLQNLRAESDALKQGVKGKEAMEVELQNLRAENDAFHRQQVRMEQLLVDLQNLRAENDALKLAQGRMQAHEVDLQNVQAENDALKIAMGQMEQLRIDLQNLRAENDALKVRAKRCDQLEVDLQNMQANLGGQGAPGTGAAQSSRGIPGAKPGKVLT